MNLASWFQKAQKDNESLDDKPDQYTLDQQGKYTDHTGTAYEIRQHMSPLHGPELQAFEWVLNLMGKKFPDANHQQRTLIEYAFSEGWFEEGDEGELRVCKEPPYDPKEQS